MRLLLIDNAHIFKDTTGNYYSKLIYDNDFFTQYLRSFSEVRFCAKVQSITTSESKKLNLLNANGLEIYPIPWYQGLKGFIFNFFKIVQSIKNANTQVDVQIYRMTQIESILAFIYRNKANPYAVEVVNDAKTYFNGIFYFIHFFAKYIIYNANGVSYITKNYLQKKYPPKIPSQGHLKYYFQTYYQTTEPKNLKILGPKEYSIKLEKLNVVHVSNNIESNIKGHKTLIKIVSKLKIEGFQVIVSFVGDGSRVNYFKKYAKKLNVQDQIIFVGRIDNKNNLYDFLRTQDIFIFPSKSEGLGRVYLEAMGAGLPCLGSNIGGVIELIDKQYLFNPTDINAYVKCIKHLFINPSDLITMSLDNSNRIKSFLIENTNDNREKFYQKLINLKKLDNYWG